MSTDPRPPRVSRGVPLGVIFWCENCSARIPVPDTEAQRHRDERGHEVNRYVVESDIERIVRARMATTWTPTPEHINALPEPVREYIHRLASRCDPAGDQAKLILLQDQVAQLSAALAERDGPTHDTEGAPPHGSDDPAAAE